MKKMRDDYIINRFTMALMGVFVKNGYFYTRVLEAKKVFIVKLSPIEIIENSLIHYGSGLNAAKKATKAALGNIDMPPIKICGSLGIYWFPSMSPKNKNCVWFSLNHIKDSIPVPNNKTKVLMEYDHTITINISKDLFKTREYRAQDLQKTFEKRTIPTLPYTYEPQKEALFINENKTIFHFKQTNKGIVEVDYDINKEYSLHIS
ncbi:competence protein ComK [Lederbergia citri]|uniref:Competence protein ComK n=1 Tax=Lederbergia citri TaxID=2833580 RepID=A0A942YIU2_9BACI|nr:competence protein ComK [Lederbergia citri]MBS4195711.1 competence protein ComK [Lederbergia citri]